MLSWLADLLREHDQVLVSLAAAWVAVLMSLVAGGVVRWVESRVAPTPEAYAHARRVMETVTRVLARYLLTYVVVYVSFGTAGTAVLFAITEVALFTAFFVYLILVIFFGF